MVHRIDSTAVVKMMGLLAFIFACGGAFPANAGPSTGGGGYAVICPASPVEPANAELLDLYEGSLLIGLTMARAAPGSTLQDEYFAGVNRTYTYQGYPDLAESRRAEILENLQRFFRIVRFVDTPAELPAADDLGNDLPWIPTNCRLQQVAYFDDTRERLTILRFVWDQMDAVSRAALVHHELTYRQMRGLKDTTSVFARRAVSHVYAVSGVQPLKHGLTRESRGYSAVLTRATGSTAGSTEEVSQFFLTPLPDLGLSRLQFSHLQGRAAFTKTWIDLPLHKWNLKFARSVEDPSYVGCIVQDSNVDLKFESRVHGTQFDGLRIRYIYKTGLPISFELIGSQGEVLSSARVGLGNCAGTAP